MLESSAIVDHPEDGWVQDVLKFWFEQTRPDQWFEKDPTFDATIRDRFLGLHEAVVFRDNNSLLADAHTALAAGDIVKVTTFLRDDARCQFWSFIDLTAVDWPGRERRFDVVYHLLSPSHNRRIRVKVESDENTP